jgi:hypothetical protein
MDILGVVEMGKILHSQGLMLISPLFEYVILDQSAQRNHTLTQDIEKVNHQIARQDLLFKLK